MRDWAAQSPSSATWAEGGSALLLTLEGDAVLTVAEETAILLVDQTNADWAQQSPQAASWALQA